MGQMMAFERYITLTKEVSWNTFPVSPSYVYCPVTDYSVTVQNQYVQAELQAGMIDGTHNQASGGTVSGGIACPLWTNQVGGKSIAQYLIDWSLNRTSPSFLESYSAVLAENSMSSSRRQTGLRVNQCTIAGSNGQPVTINLDVMGGGEVGISSGSVPAIPESTATPFAVMFNGYDLSTPGVELSVTSGQSSALATDLVDILGFNLVIANTVSGQATNSYFPTTIGAGQRKVNFSFQLNKTSDTWDLLRRSSSVNEFHIKLKLRGPHNGTAAGTYSTITFEFERISFSGAQDTYGVNVFTTQNIALVGLKPAYVSHSAIQVTYGTE